MKTAAICPIPHLEEFGNGDYHLILSHLLDDRDYANWYREQCRAGKFVILDNSAHENGSGQDMERLMAQAIALGVSEVVCPDTLFDGERTAARTIGAFETIDRLYREEFERSKMSLMIVPQGRSEVEWLDCLKEMVKHYLRFFPGRDFTVGISKDYEMWPGGILTLLRDWYRPYRARVLAESSAYVNTHLLGWGRQLWALKKVQRWFPYIRGTDSAKPFVYAMSNICLSPSQPEPEYPKRHDDYFYSIMTDEQAYIASQNLNIFRGVCNGKHYYPPF